MYVTMSLYLSKKSLSYSCTTHDHPVPPRFTQPPVNSTAVEGSQHILTCSATGDPTPIIRWSSSEGVVSNQGTLLFASVARGDAGLYTCTASSSAGSVSSQIYFNVQCECLVQVCTLVHSKSLSLSLSLSLPSLPQILHPSFSLL